MGFIVFRDRIMIDVNNTNVFESVRYKLHRRNEGPKYRVPKKARFPFPRENTNGVLFGQAKFAF
jgi:hypothetical protein